MTQELEIEFKTLLNTNDYQKIYHHYQFDKTPATIQSNIYFDTAKQDLQKKRFGLRIRQFTNDGELTLKTPTENLGLIETTDYLSDEQVKTLLANQTILETGAVASILKSHNFSIKDFIPIAHLKTHRHEIKLPIGLLALDENWYGNSHDFELELEVPNEEQGKKDFQALLQSFNIGYQPSENKIIRAIKNQ